MENFDLFLFDLDGTIIDSEKLHYRSYKLALEHFNVKIKFDYDDYVKLLHCDNSQFKNFIHNYMNDSIKFYEYKELMFVKLKNEIKFIDGADTFLNKLLESNKEICIITNSSNRRIELIKSQLPLLNKIKHWITKNDCKEPKPSPEGYIKAIQIFNIPLSKIIVFEDSFVGYKALINIPITKIFIQDPSYYFYNDIKSNNKYNDYINMKINKYTKETSIENKLNNYKNHINNFSNSMQYIVNILTPLILNCKKTIYICGIGKSNHVANKCISTWQSFGLHAKNLYVQDLFHGDFGIFQENDIIIYISNSGNTEELVDVAKYIKNNFKLLQISITNNKDNLLKQYSDFNFILGETKIIEADNINRAPSISSVLFMMTLDMLGINVAEIKELTIKDFQKYHPGGSLGRSSL